MSEREHTRSTSPGPDAPATTDGAAASLDGAAPGERVVKRARLDAVLDAFGLDELVLRDPANLAWYLGGARAHVVPLADAAVLEVRVARDGAEELRTSVIEAPRLAAEELGAGRAADRRAAVVGAAERAGRARAGAATSRAAPSATWRSP